MCPQKTHSLGAGKMKIIENEVYQWSKIGVMFAGVTDGGAATLQISFDKITFTDAMTLPLPDGELFAQVQLRDCFFKFVNITGEVNITPHP